MTTGTSPKEPTRPSEQSGGYLLLVGGLLILICLSLGTLWIMERKRRVAAEARALAAERTAARLQQNLSIMAQLGMARPAGRPADGQPPASMPAE